ncbi:MAG: RnfABCDGE type electron transport complex subunit D [Nostocaceae cyanobacterium]|nr:RnfABCDGE type electron transport complex subunit D [Nostocaceae cyanobacterium]
MLFQDIRDYQILFLSLFLILGIGTRDWTLRPELIAVSIITCILTQWIFLTIQTAIKTWRDTKGTEDVTSSPTPGSENPSGHKHCAPTPGWGNPFGHKHCAPTSPCTLSSPSSPTPRSENPSGRKHCAPTPGWGNPFGRKHCAPTSPSTLSFPSSPTPGWGNPFGRKHCAPTSPTSVLSLRSPLITSLGLSLLLRADHWTTMVVAAACAIASKFIFKVGEKHFFNPANFGIISALVLTRDAWVSPGQWGEDWWYGLLFVGAGGLILQRVGRWDTTAAFLGAYAALEGMRNLWLGWTWDVYWHRLMSGSLLLFALFMVTDPRSIPNSRTGRLIWALSIAFLTFTLRNFFYMSTAVFWALFALAPLTLLLDFLWRAPRFQWGGNE